jgi:hypothetical protein
MLNLLMASCQQNKANKLHGYWFRYTDETIDNPNFPIDLYYENDTLFMVDGSHFTHQAKYHVENDTLFLTFSNEDKLKVNFKIESDSVLSFGKGKFFKTTSEEFTSVPTYNLIGYKTDQILKNDITASNIHLIKINDTAKVILNDVTTELKDIEQFLACEDCSLSISTNLYIGRNVEFHDLLSAYKWIAAGGVRQVNLVTANTGFDDFYIEKDSINIHDLLIEELFEKEALRPFPPTQKTRNISQIILTIKDSDDLRKLNTIEDSSEYLIQVDPHISIMDYLELNQRIMDKQNIVKEIKRLTTRG